MMKWIVILFLDFFTMYFEIQILVICNNHECRNPTLKECEDDTHTPKMGTWESSGIPKNSKLDCKGQNTLPWNVLYTVEKGLKPRCRKWPRMSHSDICSTSYVQKKGQESNWQFDSRPLKVRNRPDPVRAGKVQHTVESFQGELQVCFRPHPNRRSEQGITSCQSLGSPNRDSFEIVSRLLLGSPEKKCHWDVGAVE
jgi:hypothetical protein